eukprot:Em0011g26a
MANVTTRLAQLAGVHGAIYEKYWAGLDAKKTGKVDAVTAANFLKRSQLKETILHKIWELSDPVGQGYLDKQGFYVALRLVAACQNGKEPALASTLTPDPPPTITVLDSFFTRYKAKYETEWVKFEAVFQSLQPVANKLSGEKAKPVLLATQLPTDVLGKIWSLADVDKDGFLDGEEFLIAMILASLCREGETLPVSLPPGLVPATKSSGLPILPPLAHTGVDHPATPTMSLSSSSHGLMHPHAATPPPSVVPLTTPPLVPLTTPPLVPLTTPPLVPLATPIVPSDWIVTPDVKAKYDTYFEGIDKDRDGIVSGEEVRGLFMASNVPQPVLFHIWNLCDITKSGKLNAEQFALAMFLLAEKVRGKDPPKELPPNFIPPSLRHAGAVSAQNSTPSLQAPQLSQPFGSVTSSLGPTSKAVPPVLPTSASFGPADYTAIKELDTVTMEIETIKSEKVKLQEDVKEKQEMIQQRKAEIEGHHNDMQLYVQQREQLEKEKTAAQMRLDQLDAERTRLESEVAEMKQKVENEQQEIARLKSQLSEQENSVKAQSKELEQLRSEMERLHKEETDYKQKVELQRTEMAKLQKSTQMIHSEMLQVRQKTEKIRDEHQALTTALAAYPPVVSASTATSMSELSSELHAPHVSEQDAVSARATAGSSSPVSSISGFSSNSHFDEEGKDRPDPFASALNDPFNAFLSSGSGDLFGSAGVFGRVETGNFDPFGSSDPFKTTSSSKEKENPFKPDLFATGNGAHLSDPFSGHDPFSQSTWGTSSAFDPFANNTQRQADPFTTTGDPFGEDAFGSSKT